jgi:hypothetical protein
LILLFPRPLISLIFLTDKSPPLAEKSLFGLLGACDWAPAAWRSNFVPTHDFTGKHAPSGFESRCLAATIAEVPSALTVIPNNRPTASIGIVSSAQAIGNNREGAASPLRFTQR